MQIALGQINTKIGSFEQNLKKIKEFTLQAIENKAEVVVFPELALSSYPPLDLLDRPDFLDINQKFLEKFEQFLSGLSQKPKVCVVGSIVENESPQGRPLHNAAVIFINGKKAGEQHKQLLPTYDVFDEARYFETGIGSQIFSYSHAGKEIKFGVCICEDSWFEDLHRGRKIYNNDPADGLKNLDFVINISASPFEFKKRNSRKEMMGNFAKRCNSPLIYVNQTGANDEILFDGASSVYSSEGHLLFEAPAFEETLSYFNLDLQSQKKEHAIKSLLFSDEEILFKALVTGIKDYFQKTGFKKAVLGLSGGIDSAVVAFLATEALGKENILGVSLPGPYSSIHSLTDAEALAHNLGIEYRVLSLKFINSTALLELKPAFQGKPADVTEENLQARLRAVFLMSLANKRNALLLTTGNKSEIAVGYCTTYGDMAGALAPLGDVFKTKVYALAHWMNQNRGAFIPASTLTKPPSAELRPNQKDQDSLPPYDVLDKILELYLEKMESASIIGKQGFEAELVSQVLRLVQISEFKRRQGAPVLKVTAKAFGLGRRIPIAKE